MICPACEATTPETARFCPSCGQPLVVQPDERRVATVVFADLVGFTTFSESADPEHVKNLVDTCFDRLASDVTAFGGTVDKIVGDSMVALFGAPLAHEDDPERAVRAALAIQETMRQYCADHDVDVQLRVGINTGEVLVGGLRAGDDYTAMGDVVNTASRLQELAPPGRVLVGPETYYATSATIEYEAGGAVALRGREQKIDTWLARSTKSRPGRHSARGEAPLVGRELELAALTNAVRSSEQRARAGVVLLIGEAGVGKSRLVDEVASTLQATVLRGHCIPYGETNGWSPLGDALMHLLVVESGDGCEQAIHRRLAEILDLSEEDDETRRVGAGLTSIMGLSESTDVDPVRAREEATRSLQALFEALTRESTLLLVLSDLHWADDAMFELLDSLMARLSDRPFVVMVTARPELADRWNPSIRLETNVLQLGPLDANATAALVRSHLGSDVAQSVVDALIERSGGNPFFIEELVAIASESEPGTDVGGAVPTETIRALPSTLRGLVTARLDVLAPADRGVLADCAVTGSVGSHELVAVLGAARGATDTAASLRTLSQRGLISTNADEYRFRSELVREIAYGTLTKADRAHRHARIAEWSERGHGSESEHLEQLALHYGSAASLAAELGGLEGLPADIANRAVAAHDAAAAHAERLETWARVESHLDAAIRLSDDEDGSHLERLIRTLRARVEMHRLDGVDAGLARVEALALESDDPSHEVATLLLRGRFERWRERHDEAMVAFERAIERATELGDDQSVAEGLRGRGIALLFQSRLDEARAAFEDALGIFTGIGDRRGEAWALQNLAWIAFLTGEPSIADERLDAAVAAFTELHDWGGLDWALGLRAWVRFNQGRLVEAEKLALDIYGEGEESGDAWALGMMGVLLAQVALWTGRPGDALARCRQVRERFTELDDQYGTFQSLVPIPRALACLGRFEEAASALDDLVVAASTVGGWARMIPSVLHASIAGHTGDPTWSDSPVAIGESPIVATNHELVVASALVRLQAGDVDGSLEALAAQHEQAESDSEVASSGGALAIAMAGAGRAEEALALTERLIELPDGSYLDRLQAWMGRALAAAQLGEIDLASAAADRAVELADESESPLDHAVTRLARAVTFESLGHSQARPARADAQTFLDAVGTRAPGWERAFALATSGGRAT